MASIRFYGLLINVVLMTICEAAINCNELQQAANGGLSSGSYTVTNSNGESFTVYCQFYSGYGYTFVSTNTNVDVDLTSLYDDSTHVIIRHKRSSGGQYTATLEQLSSHSSIPLHVQYNGNTGYASPQNSAMTPYIYVGFIPTSAVYNGATEGWKCNGNEYTFTNCDANPNSYIVFLFNDGGAAYTSYAGSYNSLMFCWYDTATAVSADEDLPDEFFTPYFEIHHGGCGGFAKGDSVSDISGATVGLKFVTTCSTPSDILYGSKSYTGTSVDSTLTYSCSSGFSMVSGDVTRTCSDAGGWSGAEPVCGVHGDWSDWSSWAGCTVTCDSGTWTRSRSCTNPAPVNGGNACSGSDTETGTCTLSGCPVDGNWTTWGSWNACDATCGGGNTTRTRACSNPPASNGGAGCSGDNNETMSCNTQNCPIDGGWNDWSSWTSCPVTCGSGTSSRSRSCTNPIPQYGGLNCSGSTEDTISCNTNGCPVDGMWTMWSSWSSCTVTCGGGSTDRSRECTDPAPSNGGANCTGITSESITCNDQNCPIDGDWDDWTSWTSCPVTCGTGSITRSRACVNPVPQYNGNNCTGSDSETNTCTLISCPVDGNWGSWSSSSCSATCGYGSIIRSRSCDSPAPAHGGINCTGNDIETEQCTVTLCTVNGTGVYVNQCGTEYFTCFSGAITCIDSDFRCDCEHDCDDGSDEDVTWAGCNKVQAALCSSAGLFRCDFFIIFMTLVAFHIYRK